MLTTTPFFRPREGLLPIPITSYPPSGFTSATMAMIFDVPISSPTIRFFVSLLLFIYLPALDLAIFSEHTLFFLTASLLTAQQNRRDNANPHNSISGSIAPRSGRAAARTAPAALPPARGQAPVRVRYS